ncbi:MAG: ATP-grasp domain-containing protein [Polyangiaceae bacterium]
MGELVFVESVASGHGPLSIPVAKECGFKVAFFAKDPEFYRAWGTANPLGAVDRLVVVDTDDAAAMAPHIRPDTVGIVALDDFHLIPAAELAMRFGLPHAGLAELRRTRHKDQTRASIRALTGERPRSVPFDVDAEMSDSPVGYPCVVKPSDGTASVGVRICRSRDDFRDAVRALREKWLTVRGYALSRTWLVEEFVDGPEFSVELLWNGSDWHMLGITKKIVTPEPHCVEVGHAFPAPVSDDVRGMVLAAARRWLSAVGLAFGAAHIEFRISNGEPVLMEINARLGGDMLPELIRLSTGFDELRYLFLQHANRRLEADPKEVRASRVAAIRFILPTRSGTVAEVRGAEEVRKLPFVRRLMLRPAPFTVVPTESNYDRCGFVITVGDTAEEAESNAARAISGLELAFQ